MPGYEEMPPFPTVAPSPTVRDVEPISGDADTKSKLRNIKDLGMVRKAFNFNQSCKLLRAIIHRILNVSDIETI